MIRLLCCLFIATALSAAQPTPAFAPFPLQLVSWHGDTGQISEGGLYGKLQIWVLVDWEANDQESKKRAGRDAYNSMTYVAGATRPSDHRWWFGGITSNGMPPNKNQDEVIGYAKGQDGSGGLVRAFGGDATAVMIVVGTNGRIDRIQRFSGRLDDIVTEFETLVAKADPLLASDAEVPVPAKPAALYFKTGDARTGLMLAAKKCGHEGQQLAKAVMEKAGAHITALAAVVTDATASAGDRFLASEHLIRLLEEFPQAAGAAEAAKALKATKSDVAIAAERTAWNALMGYLAAAGKQPAAKIMAFHKQSLPPLILRLKGTYAASVAEMIASTVRLE